MGDLEMHDARGVGSLGHHHMGQAGPSMFEGHDASNVRRGGQRGQHPGNQDGHHARSNGGHRNGAREPRRGNRGRNGGRREKGAEELRPSNGPMNPAGEHRNGQQDGRRNGDGPKQSNLPPETVRQNIVREKRKQRAEGIEEDLARRNMNAARMGGHGMMNMGGHHHGMC